MHAVDIGLALFATAASDVKFSIFAYLLCARKALQRRHDVTAAASVEHYVEGAHLFHAIGLPELECAAGDDDLVDGGCALMQPDGERLVSFLPIPFRVVISYTGDHQLCAVGFQR